jgi:hypothetical protein
LQQNAPGSGSASGRPSRYIRCSVDFAAPEPENHLTPLFCLVFSSTASPSKQQNNSGKQQNNSGGTAGRQRHRRSPLHPVASGMYSICSLNRRIQERCGAIALPLA